MSHPNIMALVPSSSGSPALASQAPPSSTMLSQAPPPSQAKKSRKRGAECTSNPCCKPCALRCPRAKCLTHCQDEGGCALHEVPVLEVDADGFGYYALHDALAASLAAQGLEVPPPPPPTFPSIQELLDAPAPLPPLPAPSASKTSKHPRITSQLDPIWEQDLHQRAQQEIEDNRVAQRRKEMELKSKQRFILYWFDAVSILLYCLCPLDTNLCQ